MKQYLVKNEYDEKIKVKLHNELIEDRSMMEGGKWPSTLSPYDRESFKPHYSVEIFDEGEYGLTTIYRGQFFVEDGEYDTFIVDVLYMGGTCETKMHNCHMSLLDGDTLLELSFTVKEIEAVLGQIGEKHDKWLSLDAAA
tara:strand:- start:8113 stop:8532 length:420 start_codon:yes stop_codon:yes gene_type:complete